MIIVMKAIKPAKLKEKEFRLAFLNAMRREATQIKNDYRETTKTWEHKVEFEESVSLSGPGPVMIVGTNDQIYQYVDEGTRPHVIAPKKPGGVLAFSGTFTAKTIPGVLSSGAGFKGPVDTFRPAVFHPGTKAREFSKNIQRMWQPRFKRAMEDAMREAARESGHAIK